MNFGIGTVLLTIIQSFYKGGLQQFEADGGVTGMAPGDPPEILVYHPDLPVSVRNVLKELADKAQLCVRFLTTLNYQGVEPETVQELFQNNIDRIGDELGLEGAMIKMGPLCNTIVLGNDTTLKTAEALVEKLREILPGCIRTYVMYGNDQVLRAEYRLDEEPVRAVLVKQETHTRQTVIGDDDLLNLKIALETQSVDDFIASL
jgi:hypothetical protein